MHSHPNPYAQKNKKIRQIKITCTKKQEIYARQKNVYNKSLFFINVKGKVST